MQYKMLRRGTVILEGDEFLNCDNAWVKTNMLIRVGDEGTAKKYRRPLKRKITMKIPKLEPVFGSSYCTYSVVENKLKILYENQEKIYAVVCALLNREPQKPSPNKRK